MLDSVIRAGAWTQSLFYINMYMYSNNVAYNSPTEASDYEIWKGLRDQLLFSFQFIEKPAKWNCGKVTNTSTVYCLQLVVCKGLICIRAMWLIWLELITVYIA